MSKRCREDVEDSMSRMINTYRLVKGELPPRVTVTESDYLLLGRKDPVTRERVRPVVYKGVPIKVL